MQSLANQGALRSDRGFVICYYSLYLRRVRQLIVRFYVGKFPEFDVKHVTIDAAHILMLIEELHWRVYANVVYPG